MMVALRSSKGALRRFCLLQSEFSGRAKLKQAAPGDVTHATLCAMQWAGLIAPRYLTALACFSLL